MKIAAIIRSVPDTEARLRIQDKDINRGDIDFIVNPYDEYAVEEAMRLKEKTADSTVDVYCLGPETADKQLKWALSIGADEAFRLSTNSWHNVSETASARIFADNMGDKGYEFIFTGKKSIDYDVSSLPLYLGLQLNCRVMPSAVSFEYDPETGTAEMKSIFENCRLVRKGKPPIIVCCEKGLNEPRYPSLKNIMKAKKKQVNIIPVGNDSFMNSLVSVNSLSVPSVSRKSEVIKGERPDIARRIARIISEEIKVM